jgi:Fur family transcriptional regulator, ferric uptake regulator
VKGIPRDADSDQPWRRLPATRHQPDRDVACRFQDRAGPPHVGPMRDRPGSPRGQVRRKSRVRRCRRTPRRTRPLRLRRPTRRFSETHPSALACSDIYLVSEILSELHDFRSAPEIHPALRERGGSVGLGTAARDLVLMVETGDVDVLTRDDGEAVYLRCSRQHHHHLVCRSCGYAIEITGPAAKRWADALAERHGYADISHTLVVFGLGLRPDCSSKGTWAIDPSRQSSNSV